MHRMIAEPKTRKPNVWEAGAEFENWQLQRFPCVRIHGQVQHERGNIEIGAHVGLRTYSAPIAQSLLTGGADAVQLPTPNASSTTCLAVRAMPCGEIAKQVPYARISPAR